MKFLYYLERAWLVAAGVAFVTGVFNLFRLQNFSSPVYFPLLCGLLCILLFNNVRSQRRFKEAMEKRDAAEKDKPADNTPQ